MNRIKEVDFIKCVAMIMVVTGHAGVSFIKGIPPIHVGLFFMASGFLVNYNTSFRDFFLKNIKRLYLPFVGFHIVFILFHNLWEEGWIYAQAEHYYLVLEHAFLMDVTESVLSPLWFLTALFFISVIWGLIKRLTVYLNINNVLPSHCIEMIFIMIIFLAGINYSVNGITLSWSMMNPQILNVSMVMLLVFEIGHIVRHNIYELTMNKLWGGVTAIVALVCAKFFILKVNSNFYQNVSVRDAAYGNLFLYIIVLILMWHFLYVLGSVLIKIPFLYRIFVLIGKETLWIMALHMAVLKIFNRCIPSLDRGLGKSIAAICALCIPIVLHKFWTILVELGKKFISSRKGCCEI